MKGFTNVQDGGGIMFPMHHILLLIENASLYINYYTKAE